MYGRQTECAFAAMSRLAEVYDGTTRLNAAEIADSRGLPHPFVSKVLSVLSQAELVVGSRGPGGGCMLAREPKDITLHDVFVLFERAAHDDICPFGGGRCSTDTPCAVHNKLVRIQESITSFLHETTFECFRIAYKKSISETPKSKKKKTKRSASNRAERGQPPED